ncbi:SE1832 family protein [Cytobacillus gottheilii]|uniref:SE1832 family protein n=1 Tax=Cytobacillus gottheilii TaxID=859144 RepID=UPI001594B204|nr:SE1832 family protein [Cytobacillus gottheilii]
MNEKQIEAVIAELKMEYIRLQDDVEKLESFGRSTAAQEERMKSIEEELQSYHRMKTE